jgi:hypothetical protein
MNDIDICYEVMSIQVQMHISACRRTIKCIKYIHALGYGRSEIVLRREHDTEASKARFLTFSVLSPQLSHDPHLIISTGLYFLARLSLCSYFVLLIL